MRCLQLAVGVTLANLLLSTILVYLSSSSTSSSSHGNGNQERLLLSVECPGSGEERELTPVPLSPSLSPAPSPLDVSEGVLDKYRMFKSHMFHIKGEAWAELSQKRQVCLGAQTSLDRLDQLVELASTWSGPMSIAVFAPAQELPLAQRYVDYLRRCQRAISKQVAFHLVYPIDHPPQPSSDDLVGQSMDCSSPKSVLQALLATRPESLLEWRASYPYPQAARQTTHISRISTWCRFQAWMSNLRSFLPLQRPRSVECVPTLSPPTRSLRTLPGCL